MTGRTRHEDTVALSMLRRLDEVSPVGEVPLPEALVFAGALAPGHGWDLLDDLLGKKLVSMVGSGAIRLVRLTALGRMALASGAIPVAVPIESEAGITGDGHAPAAVVPDSPAGGQAPSAGGAGMPHAGDGADRPAARMRERAGFIATIGAGLITLGALLEAVGVPEAQAAATQKGHLDLWGNIWFAAGLGAGALGLIMLLAASVLYFGRRRAARQDAG